MISTPRAFALAAITALVPGLALAQEDDNPPSDWEEEYAPSDLASTEPAAPDQAAPAEAPPASPVPAPPAEAGAPPAREVPSGQWVRTSQYGWVWMPYADSYTYVPSDGSGEPYAYVWTPAIGWSWLAAPWVWGYGPWPYFGVTGCVHYGWYGHGWWRTPQRWHWYHRPYHAAWGHVGGWRHDWRPGGGWHDRGGGWRGGDRGGWHGDRGGWHDRGGWRGGGVASPPRPGGFPPRPGGFRDGGRHR